MGISQTDITKMPPSPVETMGQLVGLFAHDLNNLLSATLTRVELAARVDDTARVRQLLSGAVDSINAQRRLIEAMARASNACARPMSLDIHEFLESRRDKIESLIAPAKLDLQLAAKQLKIFCDTAFLDAALRHIAAHARKSMLDDDVLVLSTTNSSPMERTSARRGSLLLVAAHNGKAMDEQERKNAFVAFGMGPSAADLALAQVQDTARRAGGSVVIGSPAEGRTTIQLTFPLVELAA
jgi:signal transduction histidine kinase